MTCVIAVTPESALVVVVDAPPAISWAETPKAMHAAAVNAIVFGEFPIRISPPLCDFFPGAFRVGAARLWDHPGTRIGYIPYRPRSQIAPCAAQQASAAPHSPWRKQCSSGNARSPCCLFSRL